MLDNITPADVATVTLIGMAIIFVIAVFMVVRLKRFISNRVPNEVVRLPEATKVIPDDQVYRIANAATEGFVMAGNNEIARLIRTLGDRLEGNILLRVDNLEACLLKRLDSEREKRLKVVDEVSDYLDKVDSLEQKNAKLERELTNAKGRIRSLEKLNEALCRKKD